MEEKKTVNTNFTQEGLMLSVRFSPREVKKLFTLLNHPVCVCFKEEPQHPSTVNCKSTVDLDARYATVSETEILWG